MADLLPEDKKLSNLMKKSILEMPFSDFDDKVMRRIEVSVKAKDSILVNINIAFLFFILGSGFGVASIILLPQLLAHFFNGASEIVYLTFQALFVFIVLTQIDKLIGLLRRYRSM